MSFDIKDGILKAYHGDGQKNIIIPEGVTEIESGVFALDKLDTWNIVILPNSLRHIGSDNFHASISDDWWELLSNPFCNCTLKFYGVSLNIAQTISWVDDPFLSPDEYADKHDGCFDKRNYLEEGEEYYSSLENDSVEEIIAELNLLLERNFEKLDALHTAEGTFLNIYHTALNMFLTNPEDEKVCDYIREHFNEIFSELFDKFDEYFPGRNKKNTVQKLFVLGTEKFPLTENTGFVSESLLIINGELEKYNGTAKELVLPANLTGIKENQALKRTLSATAKH